MSGTVVDLASRRRDHERAAASCSCRDGFTCYPHRLADLVRVMRTHQAETEGELLVSRADVAALIDTAIPSLEAIVRECLPNERNAQ